MEKVWWIVSHILLLPVVAALTVTFGAVWLLSWAIYIVIMTVAGFVTAVSNIVNDANKCVWHVFLGR